MNLVKILSLSALALSFSTHAADMKLPSNFKLMALNGKEVDQKVLDSLPAGKNQMVIEYSKILRDGNGTRSYESKPHIFDLMIEQDSDSYELDIKTFRKYEKAREAFEKEKVQWKLLKNGSPQAISIQVLPGKEGFFPYADLEQVIKSYNQDKGIVLTSSGVMDITESAVTINKAGKVEITGDSVTQLKLWYSKATKAERKEFRRWMIDQE